MTQRDRERLERVRARRLEDLARIEKPVRYDSWAWGLDRIQERMAKAEIARGEVEGLRKKLNGEGGCSS